MDPQGNPPQVPPNQLQGNPPPPPQAPRGPQRAGQPQLPPFDHSLVTTALELPAYTIVRNFGLVRGIIVRSRSVFGQIGASFQQMVGGNITLMTELAERTRQDAYEIMIQHAGMLGANAIVSVRYDASEMMPGMTEVVCYGTAVWVVPTGQAQG